MPDDAVGPANPDYVLAAVPFFLLLIAVEATLGSKHLTKGGKCVGRGSRGSTARRWMGLVIGLGRTRGTSATRASVREKRS